MTKKHITSLGKSFDMDAFRAKHEKVRAVGNMPVNARGDIIDSNNNVIHDANKRVSEMYQRTIQKQTMAAPKSARTTTTHVSSQPPEVEEKAPDDLDLDTPNPEK